MALWATPTAPTPIVVLAISRVFIAILKPSPSLPNIADAGTRTSSNTTSVVFDVLIPILFSSLPALKPSVPAGIRNAEIPLLPAVLSVAQVTT